MQTDEHGIIALVDVVNASTLDVGEMAAEREQLLVHPQPGRTAITAPLLCTTRT